MKKEKLPFKKGVCTNFITLLTDHCALNCEFKIEECEIKKDGNFIFKGQFIPKASVLKRS